MRRAVRLARSCGCPRLGEGDISRPDPAQCCVGRDYWRVIVPGPWREGAELFPVLVRGPALLVLAHLLHAEQLAVEDNPVALAVFGRLGLAADDESELAVLEIDSPGSRLR